MVYFAKNPKFAESSVAFVGLTKDITGLPQYILVNCDEGRTPELKFPGMRFRAAGVAGLSLEDRAKERFEEQTGLAVKKNLGLRAIMPARDRHNNHWLFKKLFFGVVEKDGSPMKPDGDRKVYAADSGQGISEKEEFVYSLDGKKAALRWATPDNKIIARIAADVLDKFDWERLDTNWYRRIPTLAAPPLGEVKESPLGCGLAISSIVLLYRPNPSEPRQIILLKRKGDEHPGYAGGKVETLTSSDSVNLDPISCCAREGAEEYGFEIQPRALICCANTTLEVPNADSERHYNSLVNYSFVAEPTNPLKVREALLHPKQFLEDKMESYVVETLREHRDRVAKRALRMPDMVVIGEHFYGSVPGDNIALTQFCSSGMI